MPQNRELYFDRVLSMYSKKIKLDDELVLAASIASSVHSNKELQMKVNTTEQSFRRYYRKKLVEILRASKPFLIEDTIIDDLAELASETTKYEEAIQHMPFPVIFFELDKTLDIEIISGKRISLRGILFGHGRDASPVSQMLREANNEDIDVFYMGLFDEGINDKSLPLEVHIDPHDLLIKDTTTVSAFDTLFNEIQVSETDGTNILKPSTAKRQTVNLEYTQKVISLCANLINYINAHNVTIKKVERQTTQEYERINRKRRSKGKSKLEPLHPYHIIVVEQSVVSQEEKEAVDETGRKMDYREMVRGHFQRYHKREGIIRYWIPRYIRGPEDAPWKENRYQVKNNLTNNK